MPHFRTVDFHPYSGHVDRPWSPDPDVDAFAKSARRVTEAYSRALSRHRLPAPAATLLLVLNASAGHDDVHVSVDTARPDGGERGTVDLPRGIAALHSDQRALLAMDVVHTAVLHLAQARSLDTDLLQQVHDQVLDEGLRFVWTSSPKASPDRRLAAAVRFELADDGFGRAQLLIHRRTDQHLVVASDLQLASATSEGFTRAAKTVRWRGSQQVQFVPFIDWLGADRGTVIVSVPESVPADGPEDLNDQATTLHLDQVTGSVVSPVIDAVTDAVTEDLPRPAVHVVGHGAGAAESNSSPGWIYGGGTSGWEGYEPFGYLQCLQSTIEVMATSTPWSSWWASAQQPAVSLFVYLPLAPPGAGDGLPASLRAPGAVTARRFEDRIEVNCRSTLPGVHGSLPLVATWVRADVERVITKLRTRFKLSAPPAVPVLSEAQLHTAEQEADAFARRRALDEP